MAAQLIRRLSDFRLFPNAHGQTAGAEPAPQPAPRRAAPEKPLLLKENAPSHGPDAAGPHVAPLEFHSQRTETPPAPPLAEPAGTEPTPDLPPAPTAAAHRRLWREELARLEANANQALKALISGAPPGTAQMAAPQDRQVPAPSGDGHDPAPDPLVLAPDDAAPAPDPYTDAGGQDPATDHRSPAIRHGMDINRRAIEQAAEDQSRTRPVGNGHDYLAMEERAIDRLLETTNALLKTDDHTRKSQSLDRQKAAFVATEAERGVRSKNGVGSVTMDFDDDDDGGEVHPMTNILTTPYTDPEKRAKRLRDYRRMILDHKTRS